MNCALRNDYSSEHVPCDECSANSRCEIYAAMQKRVIDACFDRLVSDKPDGTVRAILNKDQTELLIGAKGAPQVAAIVKILGDAGSFIIGKRFV